MIEYIEGRIVVKYIEFKNQLEDGRAYPVYLFEGEDAFFRERGYSLVKNKFVSQPELNLAIFDGEPTVGDLVASLNGYPFMSEKRMTVLKEFYPKQDYLRNGLKSYLDSPSDSGVLVILNEKPHEALKKFECVCVVDCAKADSQLLVRWIKAECNKSGVSIDGETAKALSEYCLSDMTRIENETSKLISYVGSGGVIDLTAVDEMVVRDAEYKIYEMTDFIGKRKFDKALAVINDMMSKGETAQRILVSVYNYFRRLLLIAISDKPNSELASMLGIKEFAVRKTKDQAEMFKKRALKSAVDMLTDVDYKIKRGILEANDAMWLSIFKIMLEN